MLVLNRKQGESILIDDRIEIKVLEIIDGKIKIGIVAPKEVTILRKEIYDEIRNENMKASDVSLDNFNRLKGSL
ncbi:carbon storage regulator CsrA [Proteiniclasticum sp.]|uniref:carbon storage regulator CsrA n=1 Tax=Proteiniclasticum sp. TaxID=2053595 RepID=UPI0028983364|nr:carbon storage regulator CsrA [Proteiniclasticum sp.]